MAESLTCITCSRNIGKSGYKIQCCGVCKGWTHLRCTDITKEDIAGKEKIDWTCKNCEMLEEEEEEDTVDESLEELTEKLKRKRKSLNKMKKEEGEGNIERMLKQILKKMETLEVAVTFNSKTMDEILNAMEEMKRENKDLRKKQQNMETTIEEMGKELNSLREQVLENAATSDAQNRRKNIIVIGLKKKEEIAAVFNKLEVKVPENEMKIRQLPSKNPIKPILISFDEEKTKNMVIQQRKVMGVLSTRSMGLEGEDRRIYINEDLPKGIQDLLKKAKELKNSGYRYIWSKENKVFCRKGEYTKIIHIQNINQVEEIKKTNLN